MNKSVSLHIIGGDPERSSLSVPDSDSRLCSVLNLAVDLGDGAGNETAVFVVLRDAGHCESLTRTGLTIAHQGS